MPFATNTLERGLPGGSKRRERRAQPGMVKRDATAASAVRMLREA
ncbi:MAG TPA: hypothetical protein VIC61_04095 [Gammaproteobacteria bacterium]